MAFDASRQSDPDHEPAPFQDEPIDFVDWAMRIAVFGPLLALYLYWIWTVLKTAFVALLG
ncbi:MAG: hypothetical protein KF779_10330 [Hyphomonadaceae bacterium]|nr:hypothetical protein [Hyphomonadaceae bacterium]